MFKVILGLTIVGLAIGAEVKQEYCNKYAQCHKGAFTKFSECQRGFTTKFMANIPSDNIAPLDRIHCEQAMDKFFKKSLKPVYNVIEEDVKKCFGSSIANYTIDDSIISSCEATEIHLPGAKHSLEGQECIAAYDEDIKRCGILAACCPQYDECYEKTKAESGVGLKEQKLVKKFKECIANPPKSHYMHDTVLLQKLATSTISSVQISTGVPEEEHESEAEQKATEAPVAQVPEKTKEDEGKSEESEEQQEQTPEESKTQEEQQPEEEPKPFKNNVKEVDFKEDKPEVSFNEDSKPALSFSLDEQPQQQTAEQQQEQHEQEPDEIEEDDEVIIHKKKIPKIAAAEKNVKIHSGKTVLELNESERQQLENARVYEGLKELRKAKTNGIKGQIQKEDIVTDKKVIHNVMCSQYMECSSIVERLDDECETKFPVKSEINHGIVNRHIRWQFMNSSKATDEKIRESCLKNIDPVSQQQLQALQTIVNNQNDECTKDRAVGRKSADFDGCENVGLLAELIKLNTIPISDDKSSNNDKKQGQCKERHAEFGRRCRALRTCCPDTTICDQTNNSVEARELRHLKTALKTEQRLCEERLTRNQQVAKNGVAGVILP